VKVSSIVGILPLLAVVFIDQDVIERAQTVGKRFSDLLERRRVNMEADDRHLRGKPGDRKLLLGVVPVDRVLRLLEKLFDEAEFLSPYGLRAVSRRHLEHPSALEFEGMSATVDYEPAESTTGMFGGNSNWRGPIWFPINYLVVSALHRYARFFGDEFTIEYPTGSGNRMNLEAVTDDLRSRLISIFLPGPDGRRPSYGWVERLQTDPAWKDNIFFNEYFHGDNGAGLGANHQTGWTGVIARVMHLLATASAEQVLEFGKDAGAVDVETPASSRQSARPGSRKR
jgi:hypothetical protein